MEGGKEGGGHPENGTHITVTGDNGRARAMDTKPNVAQGVLTGLHQSLWVRMGTKARSLVYAGGNGDTESSHTCAR